MPAQAQHAEELAKRVESTRHRLQSELTQLAHDPGYEAREELARIKIELGEIEDTLRAGLGRLSEGARRRLNELLDIPNAK